MCMYPFYSEKGIYAFSPYPSFSTWVGCEIKIYMNNRYIVI